MKLLNRLFGRTKTTQAVSDSLTLTAAVKKILEAHASLNQIVNDYGATLASSAAPWPGCVADARKLPHSKEDIKRALMYFLLTVEDSQLRSALKICYTSLAQWQEGVGDTDVGFASSKIDIRRVQDLSHKLSLFERRYPRVTRIGRMGHVTRSRVGEVVAKGDRGTGVLSWRLEKAWPMGPIIVGRTGWQRTCALTRPAR